MDSQDTQVLAAALRWAAAGHRFTLVTVVKTWGSAPRPPGSWMIVRDDGRVQGSVSGGCIEADLIERVQAGEFAASPPFVMSYGVTLEEARRFGLPCGGRMELVLEPVPDLAALAALQQRVEQGQLARRRVVIGQPGNTISAAAVTDGLTWDGQTLTTLHGPAWRLLIIGAGQVSTYLAQMAPALDYQVFICDPRSEYTAEWQVPGTTLLSGMPDDAVIELKLDPHSAVVALTHDPKLDDMALLEALKSPAFYVGALGSTLNSQRRRERLLEYFDLTPAQVGRLHGPVGLRIGSRTPPEIAIAVLAEMTAVRNGVLGPEGLRQRTMSEAGCGVPERGMVGILLAAGSGQRFGGDKLLHRLPDGRPLAVAAALNLRPACDQLVAVLRPGHDALAEALAATGCTIVHCAEAELGMGHSLAAGIRATAHAAGWIVALGDMPFIAPRSHQAVAACLRGGASLVATQYQHRRGHPVGFSHLWGGELAALTGDQGGRAILERHREEDLLCPVDDPGVLLDIDHPADLMRRSIDG